MALAFNNVKKGILGKIGISYIIFITFIVIFNHNNIDRLSSFLTVFLSGIIALLFLGWNSKKTFGFTTTKYIIVGFLIKLFIGYFFWEFYMFPDYFSNALSQFKFSHYEYLITEQWMKALAEQRIAVGFFYIPPQLLITVNHFPLYFLMSNLYLSGSFNPFDLSVQNSLFSIFSAFVILGISKKLGATSKQMKYVLIIAIFQPFSMISSIIWRDVFGQLFVVLGGYLTLLALNKKGIGFILILFFASLSMMMQRSIYFFFPIIAFTSFLMLKSRIKYKGLLLLFIIGGAIFFNGFFDLSETLSQDYGANIANVSLWIYLPLNILRVFIGPFPWTNWLKFDDQTIFLIADYLQSVISITFVILTLISIKKRQKHKGSGSKYELLLLFLFIPFVFAALGTIDIHQGYMTTGIIFLIPFVLMSTTYLKFIKLNFFVFLFFICLNILFIVSGFSGSGIGSLFR